MFCLYKRYPLIQHAPKHFHKAIVLGKLCLTKNDFDFAWTYYQYNCYPAHPESLLLAMLGDSDSESKRTWAANKIIGKKHALKDRTNII